MCPTVPTRGKSFGWKRLAHVQVGRVQVDVRELVWPRVLVRNGGDGPSRRCRSGTPRSWRSPRRCPGPGRIQGVLATPSGVADSSWLSASAGVRHPRVFLGRPFSAAAMSTRSSAVCTARSLFFGQVLTKKAVGVLVGPALPGTVRITEVDIDVGVDR